MQFNIIVGRKEICGRVKMVILLIAKIVFFPAERVKIYRYILIILICGLVVCGRKFSIT